MIQNDFAVTPQILKDGESEIKRKALQEFDELGGVATASFKELKDIAKKQLPSYSSRLDKIKLKAVSPAHDPQLFIEYCVVGHDTHQRIDGVHFDPSTSRVIVCPASLRLPDEALDAAITQALVAAIDPCEVATSPVPPPASDPVADDRACVLRQINDPAALDRKRCESAASFDPLTSEVGSDEKSTLGARVLLMEMTKTRILAARSTKEQPAPFDVSRAVVPWAVAGCQDRRSQLLDGADAFAKKSNCQASVADLKERMQIEQRYQDLRPSVQDRYDKAWITHPRIRAGMGCVGQPTGTNCF
jgi:hypothetical protein